MYRRISVHLDQGFDCKRRTQAAIGLAKRHQAELVGIYATPRRRSTTTANPC